jgi:hypothetical protein
VVLVVVSISDTSRLFATGWSPDYKTSTDDVALLLLFTETTSSYLSGLSLVLHLGAGSKLARAPPA